MADNSDELNNWFKSSAEDFSLTPSPTIWKKVEREIAGRERKRRFIIFFLLGSAMLLGGAVWFMNYPAGKKNVLAQNQDSTVLTPPSVLQEEKQKTPVSNNGVEQSSFGQNNSGAIPGTQKHLKTGEPQKEAGQPVTEKSIDRGRTDQTSTGDANEKTQDNSSNGVDPKKIVSQLSALPNFTNEIKTSDNLQEKPVEDSLHAVHLVAFSKDSVPGKKDTVSEPSFTRKWSFTYGAALATSFTKFSERGDYQFVAHYRDSSDKAMLTQNLHFNISYHVFPRVEIFTGIGLVNYQERMLNRQVVYRNDTLPVSGPFPPSIAIGKGFYHVHGDSMRGVTNKIFYLQVPLGIRYNVVSSRKWNIGVQPEISFNKAIYTKGYMYSHATREYKPTKLSDLRPLNIGYGIGLSFRYELRRNLQLEMMPYFFGMQRSVFSSSILSQKFWQSEARVSLHYTFPE